MKKHHVVHILLACSVLTIAQENHQHQPSSTPPPFSLDHLVPGAIDGRVHSELISDDDAFATTLAIFATDPKMVDALIDELRSGRDRDNKPITPLSNNDRDALKAQLMGFFNDYGALKKKHDATMVSPVSTQTLASHYSEYKQMVSNLQGTLRGVLTADGWNTFWRRVQDQKRQMVVLP